MDRLVNSGKAEYHSEVITSFSDTTRPMSSGVSRSFSSDKYSWVADFLFKHSTNISTNKHIAYLSFFSDSEIFKNEYGNFELLYTHYPFLPLYERLILSPYTFELSGKQYSKIGQKRSEVDCVEYINASFVDLYNLTDPKTEYEFIHNFYRKPAYHTEGYVVSLGDPRRYYRQLIFSTPGSSSTKIGENSFEWSSIAGWTDDVTATEKAIIDGNSNVERVLDCKVNVENQDLFYFDNISSCVIYYNQSQHYQADKYDPNIQSVVSYDRDWNEIYISSLIFFPEIISGNFLEPAKVIAAFQSNSSPIVAFNSMCHSNEADDQSKLIFNICRHMTVRNGSGYDVRHWDPLETMLISDGVDIETERQRRYSSVVMTEPYFVTEPICGGRVCHYSFVDKNNQPINYSTTQMHEAPHMYLKLKASNDIVKEIERLINLREFNTDIINTIKISVDDYRDNFHQGANYFDTIVQKFSPDPSAFYLRQDACLDDLIGEFGTSRTYHVFNAPAIGDQSDKYDGGMKISGLGYCAETVLDNDGVTVLNKEFINIYCSNHTPSAPPSIDNVDVVIPPNESVPLFDDTVFVPTSVEQYERFRPMIKIHGINGYVKIISRNRHIPMTRSSDGLVEVVYNVEFPYAPGSYSERNLMRFTSDDLYKSTLILYKKAYIPAGDESVHLYEGAPVIEISNQRSKFSDMAAFSWHQLLTSATDEDSLYTASEKNGGEISTSLNPSDGTGFKSLIEYPRSSVFKSTSWDLFSLFQPEHQGYGHLGTYAITFRDPLSVHGEEPVNSDLKIVRFSDNRRWKYDDDKYESYINRENPSYVFEIDLNTLFEDFTIYQSQHGSIPDIKRWLYSYVRCSATTIKDVNVDNTEYDVQDLFYTVEEDVSAKDTNSEIIIEIWDNESKIKTGSDRGGNWVPIVPGCYDNKKVPGEVIIDGLYVSIFDDYGASVSDPLFVGCMLNNKNNMYHIPLIPFGANAFPDYLFKSDFDESNPDFSLTSDGLVNKVLYNKNTGISFHIAFVKRVPAIAAGAPRDIILAYIICDNEDDFESLVFCDNIVVDGGGPLQIRDSSVRVGQTPIDIFSSTADSTSPEGTINRYFDIRSGLGDPSDIERYVDGDGKMFFRVRVARAKEYPISLSLIDQSELQHAIIIEYDDIASYSDDSVNPWISGALWDDEFDFSKILLKERVKKIGIDYFRCSSK